MASGSAAPDVPRVDLESTLQYPLAAGALQGRVFIVTGATGHIGSCLAATLLLRGDDFRLILPTRAPSDAEAMSRLSSTFKRAGFAVEAGDRRVLCPSVKPEKGAAALRVAVENAWFSCPSEFLVRGGTLVHLAANVSWSNTLEEARADNVEPLQNLLASEVFHKNAIILYGQTYGCVPSDLDTVGERRYEIDPSTTDSAYAATKIEAEDVVRNFAAANLGAKCGIFRIGAVGPTATTALRKGFIPKYSGLFFLVDMALRVEKYLSEVEGWRYYSVTPPECVINAILCLQDFLQVSPPAREPIWINATNGVSGLEFSKTMRVFAAARRATSEAEIKKHHSVGYETAAPLLSLLPSNFEVATWVPNGRSFTWKATSFALSQEETRSYLKFVAKLCVDRAR